LLPPETPDHSQALIRNTPLSVLLPLHIQNIAPAVRLFHGAEASLIRHSFCAGSFNRGIPVATSSKVYFKVQEGPI
jgi:hypothetical protein